MFLFLICLEHHLIPLFSWKQTEHILSYTWIASAQKSQWQIDHCRQKLEQGHTKI